MSAWRLRPGIALLALAASLHYGVPTSPARPDKKAAPAGPSYEVDSKSSRIYVKVGTATRLGHEHGVQGSLKSGKLSLGGGGEFIFDMASFIADTTEARERVGL